MSTPDQSAPPASSDAAVESPAAQGEFTPANSPSAAEFPAGGESLDSPVPDGAFTAGEPTGGPGAVESPELGLASLVHTLGRIEDKLTESQRLIDRQAEIAAKLHAENQALRGGELRKAQAALVLNVLRVYDDVTQMAVTADDLAASKDLGIIADALADALARGGIDPSMVTPGERFEARRHKIAAIEPTADADSDRTIARVVRPGFVWSDGEVVRVSDVAVFKYTPRPEPAEDDVRDAASAAATEPSTAPPDVDSTDALPRGSAVTDF